MYKSIGLDLGSSTLLYGIWQNDEVNIKNTISQTQQHLTNIKRLIGKSADDEYLQQNHHLMPYTVEKHPITSTPLILVNRAYYIPQDAYISQLLDLELAYSTIIATVPSIYSLYQRQIILQAFNDIGLKVKRLINESTAIAIAYNHIQKLQDRQLLIINIGGCHIDMSTVHFDDNLIQIVSLDGTTNLGGQDFDEVIMQHCIKECRLTQLNEQELLYLRQQCVLAKHQLSEQQLIYINFAANDELFNLQLTRDQFNKMCANLYQNILQSLQNQYQYESIVLVGGTAKIPELRVQIQLLFPNTHVEYIADSSQMAVIGATIYAETLQSQTSNLVIIESTPHAIGITIDDGTFFEIISKNSAIPTIITQRFNSSNTQQGLINFLISEGENMVGVHQLQSDVQNSVFDVILDISKSGKLSYFVYNYTSQTFKQLSPLSTNTDYKHRIKKYCTRVKQQLIFIKKTDQTRCSIELIDNMAIYGVKWLQKNKQATQQELMNKYRTFQEFIESLFIQLQQC